LIKIKEIIDTILELKIKLENVKDADFNSDWGRHRRKNILTILITILITVKEEIGKTLVLKTKLGNIKDA